MSSIYLFNIGFRCENICRELNKYKNHQYVNRTILNDSKNVVIDCFKIKESDSDSLSSNDLAIGDFYPLLFRAFPQKKIDDIVISLKEIKLTLENIDGGSITEDVTSAYSFFNTLSDLCLSHQEHRRENTNYI